MKISPLFRELIPVAPGSAIATILAFACLPAHANTVWNVNVGSSGSIGAGNLNEITTGANYQGAATENTANSLWNAVTAEGTMTLADSTGDNSAGVIINLTAASGSSIQFGNADLTSGDKIFCSWIKDVANSNPFTVNFGNLPALGSGESYSLVVYSDWYWGPSGVPVQQTAGTGLVGTFTMNSLKGNDTHPGTAGYVGNLLQDTDAADADSGYTNYARFDGLAPDGSGNLAFSMSGVDGPVNGFQLIRITADTTPPAPDPMTWASGPTPVSESSITMTATTATDASGVQYLFTCTAGGGHSSNWQDSPTYTDSGLSPSTTYTYTVTARDNSIAHNTTAASAPLSATSLPADTTAPTPSPMSFAVAPAAVSPTEITMTATTASDPSGVEYYFAETSGNLGGSDSGWQDSPVYTDAGLTPHVTYTYTVKVRDKSYAHNTTAVSAPASATTPTETTVSTVWNVNIGPEITPTDNFVGAAGENIANSTWNHVTSTPQTGMALVDDTGTATDVSLDLSGSPVGYPGINPTGDMIFYHYIGGAGASANMTIKGLSMSKAYDVIIYSDWYWRNGDAFPVSQTAGTGMSGTIYINPDLTGTNGTVPPLTQDTNPADVTTGAGNVGNWFRIKGLVPDANGQLGFYLGQGNNAPFSGFQLIQTGSTLARITSFGIPGADGVIDNTAKTIALTVPYGTDLAALAPNFTLSSGTCNRTSGAPPSPTFATSSTVHYVVTDSSTSPSTVNDYAVTVTVAPGVGTLVINLGTGTVIPGGTYIGSGPTNLPIPTLPTGSILRSIAVNATLELTDNSNYASELDFLIDPTPGTPGGDFSLEITNGNSSFGATRSLGWPSSANAGVGTNLVDTKTDADWSSLGAIDLSTVGVFLGNAYISGISGAGGTWSGTITLTYDIPTGGSPYATWATGNETFGGDANGDGVTDGIAFLLGAANPAEKAIGRLPTAHTNGGLVLNFSCLSAANRGSSALSVQWSNDLGVTDAWSSHSAAVPESSGTVNGVNFVITPNGGNVSLNDVQATIPSSQGSHGKLFARLKGMEN